jgi:CBS domain-containing protein
MLVRDVMTSGPVTVTAGTGVKDALGQLARHGITSMPVLDRAGRLQGIVSEVDLIGETVSRDPRAQERPIVMAPVHPPRLVDEVCTRSVVTVRSEDDVATAVELMTATGAKSLPVLDENGRLAGMLSRSDVVAAMARSDEVIAADIDELLHSLGHGDWLVEVDDGSVDISGPSGAAEHSLAHAVAHTIPGVVEVRISC